MEEFINNVLTKEVLINMLWWIVVLAVHSILTYAVYKWKGGPIACFYFFLAPIAVIVLIGLAFFSAMAAGSSSSSNTVRHDHYFHD